MIKIIVLALMIPLMVGCGVNPVKFNGPNGKTAYSMECNELADCYIKSSEICKSGYTVIDARTGYISTGKVGVTKHTLAIECK